MPGRTALQEAIEALMLAEHAAAAYWTPGVSEETVLKLFALSVEKRRQVLALVERSVSPAPIDPEQVWPLRHSSGSCM